jgi:hypothetical protein
MAFQCDQSPCPIILVNALRVCHAQLLPTKSEKSSDLKLEGIPDCVLASASGSRSFPTGQTVVLHCLMDGEGAMFGLVPS